MCFSFDTTSSEASVSSTYFDNSVAHVRFLFGTTTTSLEKTVRGIGCHCGAFDCDNSSREKSEKGDSRKKFHGLRGNVRYQEFSFVRFNHPRFDEIDFQSHS
jgi:hypothetical protein